MTANTYKEPVVLAEKVQVRCTNLYTSNVLRPRPNAENRDQEAYSLTFALPKGPAADAFMKVAREAGKRIKKADLETWGAIDSKTCPFTPVSAMKYFDETAGALELFAEAYEPMIIKSRCKVRYGRPAHYKIENGKPVPTVFGDELKTGDAIIAVVSLLHASAMGNDYFQVRLHGVINLGMKDPRPFMGQKRASEMSEEEYEEYVAKSQTNAQALDVSGIDLNSVLAAAQTAESTDLQL